MLGAGAAPRILLSWRWGEGGMWGVCGPSHDSVESAFWGISLWTPLPLKILPQRVQIVACGSHLTPFCVLRRPGCRWVA